MADFLKVHTRKDNEEVFVNLDNIVYVKDVERMGMTRIATTSGEAVYVKETTEEIFEKAYEYRPNRFNM